MLQRRPRPSRRELVTPSVCVAVCVFALAARAQAQSPWDASIESFEVPEGCTTRDAFAARLDALGAVPGAVVVTVEVGASWSGLLRGVVVLTRTGAAPVERAIEDEVCADVLDALAIAAALYLREPPVAEATPPDDNLGLRDPVVEGPIVEDPPPILPRAPGGARVRVALGAGLRVGLGPVPGLAIAPDVVLSVEVDRFFLALHALGWPEAAAPDGAGNSGPPPTPGVAMYALGSTLELGARLGDDVAVVPAAVLELGAVVGRGVGVERPRTDVAFACDAGIAATAQLDLGPVRLFVRADLLFAVTQPAYVVGGLTAYQAPVARGTGMLGLAYVFGS